MACESKFTEMVRRHAMAKGGSPPTNAMLRAFTRAFFAGLEAKERRRSLDNWDLWALPYQRMPVADGWRTWAMIGGRGIGKSWTASKTVHEVAKDPDSLGGGIIAIVGRTHTDVRSTNIEAKATGLLAAAPEGFRPSWRPGPGLLEWPNGVRGRVFAAVSPESIRGQNIAFVVGDEVAQWPKGDYVWHDLLSLACRLGRAQMMMTTTPRPLKWLREIVDADDTIVTGATTYDNPYLSDRFLKKVRSRFEGTAVGEQELGGKFLDTVAGALLKRFEYIADHRVTRAEVPDLVRIVIGVDPAITANRRSDMTGIVVFGVDKRGHGYVLEDATDKYDIKLNEWAEVVVGLYRKYQADMVVGEINRGGDMVEGGLRAVSRNLPFTAVRATRGKFTRSQPVGALYEQGKIHHVGVHEHLEQELTTWVEGDPSPNRLDAVVWAATHLMLDEEAAQPWASPLGYLGETA